MPCLLHCIGESFDPSFLPELASLRPYSVYQRGDAAPSGSRLPEAGGFSCEVSPHSDWGRLVDDSIAFLGRHHEQLRELAQVPTIAHRSLSMHVGNSEVGQRLGSFTLPPRLLRLCADADLTIQVRICGPAN